LLFVLLLPYYLLLTIQKNNYKEILKYVVVSTIAFILTTVILSLAFSQNFIELTLKLLAPFQPHGLSYFVILRDAGVDIQTIKLIGCALLAIGYTFLLILSRRRFLNTIQVSILFFIILYASMYYLTPMYLSWIIPFLILYYINTRLLLLLIPLDIATNVWSIAKCDLNCTPLVYASILTVWIILIKCAIDAMVDKYEDIVCSSSER